MSVTTDDRIVVVDASSPDSQRCSALADRAELETRGLRIRLGDLSAPALLRRGRDPQLDAAVGAVLDADVVVFVTPVHRGSYSGLLKVFADVLHRGALDGTAAVVAATGRNPSHRTPVARAMRDLVEALGGRVVAPTLVLSEDDDVVGERVGAALRAALSHAGLVAHG